MKDKDTVSPKPDLLDIPEPIGNVILKAVSEGKIQQVMGANGAWYHYVDVCKLLDNYGKPLQSRIAELEKENQNQFNHLCEKHDKVTALESRLRAANEYLEAQGMHIKF